LLMRSLIKPASGSDLAQDRSSWNSSSFMMATGFDGLPFVLRFASQPDPSHSLQRS
jgi:hypothetical protein